LNSKVLSYVELFQGNLRSFMEEGLERGSQYLPMIQDVFKSEGLPLDLAYLPLIESAFKNTALSRASAKGMWQFELGTAKDYGLSQDWFLDERSDPMKATRAAAQHLKMLIQMFDGDWNMALASYNAGQGRILRAVKLSKQSDYWKLTSTSRYLPRETREYVPMVMAAIIIAKNPAQYGFNIDTVETPQSELVTIPNALDLRFIAEWTGVSIDDIRALNPELRRTLTPLGKHDLRVPLGTAASVEAKLATADASIFKPINLYTVKKGDTITSVARSHKISTDNLLQANDLKKGSRNTMPRLRPGQQLQVPFPSATATAALTSTSKRPVTPVVASPATTTYRVKPGDTLSAIARQFAMSVTDLKKLNQLSSDSISVGDKLTVRR
jgi:membrane-bound lytic murein transglycosylase D